MTAVVIDLEDMRKLAATDPLTAAVRQVTSSVTPEQQARIDAYFNEEDFGPIIVNELTKPRYDRVLHELLAAEACRDYDFDESLVPGFNQQMRETAVAALLDYEELHADEIGKG